MSWRARSSPRGRGARRRAGSVRRQPASARRNCWTAPAWVAWSSGMTLALRDLERIVHPAVRQRILDDLAAVDRTGAPAVVIEAINFVEGGLGSLCDEFWLVTCDPTAQAGLVARRGTAPDDARARFAAQATSSPGSGPRRRASSTRPVTSPAPDGRRHAPRRIPWATRLTPAADAAWPAPRRGPDRPMPLAPSSRGTKGSYRAPGTPPTLHSEPPGGRPSPACDSSEPVIAPSPSHRLAVRAWSSSPSS